MAYQEVTTENYGQRLGNSFKGILTGILAIAGGSVLVWWNEGRAVKTSDMLNEAQDEIVEMQSVESVDPKFEGKLVHAIAPISTEETLTDPVFGLKATNAIRLFSEVEYYQYVQHSHEETKEKVGGTKETVTTYTYEKQWVSKPVDSNTFKDPDYKNSNFTLTTIEEASVYAKNVAFGAYRLSDSQIRSFSNTQPFAVEFDAERLAQLNARYGGSVSVTNVSAPAAATASASDSTGGFEMSITKADGTTETTGSGAPQQANAGTQVIAGQQMVHVSGNTIYIGKVADGNQIGDVRVKYFYAEPTTCTIGSVVSGNSFRPYVADNGYEFDRLTARSVSCEQMFEDAHSENNMTLWIFRIVALLVVCFGFRKLFAFASAIVNFLPFLAKAFSFGVNIFANVLGAAWTLIVGGLAWMFYRPITTIIVLGIAGFLIYWFIVRPKETKAAAQTPEVAPAPAGGEQQPGNNAPTA